MQTERELDANIDGELEFLRKTHDMLTAGKIEVHSKVEGRKEDITPIMLVNIERLTKILEDFKYRNLL